MRLESDSEQNSGVLFMCSGDELTFDLQPWVDVTAFKEAIAAVLSKAAAPHPQLLNLWCLELIPASSYEQALLAVTFMVQVRKLNLCGSDVLLFHRFLVQARDKLLYPNSNIWEQSRKSVTQLHFKAIIFTFQKSCLNGDEFQDFAWKFPSKTITVMK